jgi:hypothetical protein
MIGLLGCFALGIQLLPAQAQFPPPLEGVKVLKSRFSDNVTISYKEVRK